MSPTCRPRAAVLLVLALLAGVRTGMGGTTFSSVLDEFVVLFPAAPRVESAAVELGGGRRATMRIYETDEPATQWLVSATDVSQLALDAGRALSGARRGVLERGGGTLLGEHPVLVAHYQGLELRLERKDHSLVRVRICVTPRRIYEVMVMTTEERKRLPQIERFFESFSPE